MRIEITDALDFARGAAFLGTGGGGDPYIGRLLLEQALRDKGPANVIPVTELDDDALVVPIAGMSSTSNVISTTEMIPSTRLSMTHAAVRRQKPAKRAISADSLLVIVMLTNVDGRSE